MAKSECTLCGGTGQIEESYSSSMDLADYGCNWRFTTCYKCQPIYSGKSAPIDTKRTDFTAMKKTLEYMMLPREELERLSRLRRAK